MVALVGITAEVAPVDLHWGRGAHHVLDVDYVTAVRRSGAVPILLPVLDPGAAAALVARVDAVIVSGGADIDPARYGAPPEPETTGVQPERDAWELAVLDAALAAGAPTLAICRGLQLLNVALGGSLVQHLPRHPSSSNSGEGVHGIEIDPASPLAALLGERNRVNSFHHQAIDRPGHGVRIAARADDGTIEAITVEGAPRLLAVQWHPECHGDRADQQALFRWLIEP